MPATMTFKTVKNHAMLLPKKQKALLAETLLQDEYEQECFEKAEQALRDYESGKTHGEPLDKAMRDLRAYSKSLDRKQK